MVGNTLVTRVARFVAPPFIALFTMASVVNGFLPAIANAQSLGQSNARSPVQVGQPSLDAEQTRIESDSLPDFEPPIIEHTVLNGGVLGAVEVFGATVVDNDKTASVTLFYRFSGENEYAQVSMREIASSSFYSAKVDTANVPAGTDSIDYYLQAEDVSGNLVLKGFAFQPLVRFFELNEPVTQVPEQPTAVVPQIKESEINWVYVGLGVLAVGAIAALAGGGGGSSDDCVGGCDVTVTFDRP